VPPVTLTRILFVGLLAFVAASVAYVVVLGLLHR
jgi:hypothetical protein